MAAEAAVEARLKAIEKAFGSFVKAVSRQLERDGYAHIEWLRSEEHVSDMLFINNYLFTEHGSRTVELDESLSPELERKEA